MQFQVIHTPEAWETLAPEWNHLLASSARDVPFLRYEALSAWWNHRGGGEWQNGQLQIITARREGRLVAAAPLFLSSGADQRPTLLFVGSYEIFDYLDFLAEPEILPEFIPALLAFLDSEALSAWKTLDLYNLLEGSPSLPALQLAAQQCGWSFNLTPLQKCPTIPLPGSWDGYLAGIDKKQRHEIRRKMRRVEESGSAVRWYTVSDPQTLPSEMEAFFNLMTQEEAKARFLTAPMRLQMLALAQVALQAGWLQLAFLEVDGQKAAAYLNFDYGGKIWVYNSGLNPAYRELSPGWVLLGHLLQWANENGRSQFDFMRGDEEYKYRFGAQDQLILRAQVSRP